MRLFTVAATSLAWAGVALAQTSDPYANPWARMGPVIIPGDATPKNASEIMHKFADCTVRLHHDAARKYLLLPLGSTVPEKEYREIADPRCLALLSGRLTMGELAYRGALAEEMMRWDGPHSAIDPSNLASLDWSVPGPSSGDQRSGPNSVSADEKAHETAVAASSVGRLGECVVRATPGGSLAVLHADTASAEANTFHAIVPQIAGCIQRGETKTFTRNNLRSAIALSYYRLAFAARQNRAEAAAQ